MSCVYDFSWPKALQLVARRLPSTVRILHNMPIPSSSSPPQPITAGSSECCSRPYVASLNSDKGAPDIVVVSPLLGVASVEPVVAVAVTVGEALYQLICLWPTSGMLGPLARPYKDFLRSMERNGMTFTRLTCSAAARVLNVTTMSPFSSVSSASTWPPASYQSRTACMLSLPMSWTSNFLGLLSSFMLERTEPPRAAPR